MLKRTIEIMTTREAMLPFLIGSLREEYKEELEKIDFTDDYSIQYFLDNEAVDVHRLTEKQCELLDLNYDDGYYI